MQNKENKNKIKKKTKKSDRRVIKTLERIYYSIIELLSYKKINDIGISEIADTADVSRSTVYAHFNNNKEIILWIGSELLDEKICNLKDTLANCYSALDAILVLVNDMISDRILNKILYWFFVNIDETGTKALVLTENLNCFLDRLENLEQIWIDLVINGKKDKIIRSELESSQIVQIIFVLLVGISDQIISNISVLQKNHGFEDELKKQINWLIGKLLISN